MNILFIQTQDSREDSASELTDGFISEEDDYFRPLWGAQGNTNTPLFTQGRDGHLRHSGDAQGAREVRTQLCRVA